MHSDPCYSCTTWHMTHCGITPYNNRFFHLPHFISGSIPKLTWLALSRPCSLFAQHNLSWKKESSDRVPYLLSLPLAASCRSFSPVSAVASGMSRSLQIWRRGWHHSDWFPQALGDNRNRAGSGSEIVKCAKCVLHGGDISGLRREWSSQRRVFCRNGRTCTGMGKCCPIVALRRNVLS